MLNLKISFQGKCDRHPKYDPAAEGEAGIIANCPRCHALLGVWATAKVFKESADRFLGRL